jgi:hypothetical protein
MAQTKQTEIIYPLPDPAWEYSVLWGFLNKAQSDLQILIAYTARFEQASPEIDQSIGIQLEAIAESISLSLALLKRS